MEKEFTRYKLERYRKTVGILELLGATGLALGLKWNSILILSSGGLGLLMLFGFVVRIKIKDGILPSLPSFIYMIFCFYIFNRVC